MRKKAPEWNWLSPDDIANFLRLADFETVQVQPKVLLPIYIPLLSTIVNRYVAPLPLLSKLCLVNILIARPVASPQSDRSLPSVSVVVPARNEAGNIEAIVDRLPKMGPDDELIFVEGGSKDATWQRIKEVHIRHASRLNIQIAQQEGKAKVMPFVKGFRLPTMRF